MKIILYILIFTSLITGCLAQKEEIKKDTVIHSGPFISLSTNLLRETKGNEKFLTREFFYKNEGDSLLLLKRITASCMCATATILNSRLEPGKTGRLMLYVNLSSLDEDSNELEYIIESNAVNSPTSFRIEFTDVSGKSSEKK